MSATSNVGERVKHKDGLSGTVVSRSLRNGRPVSVTVIPDPDAKGVIGDVLTCTPADIAALPKDEDSAAKASAAIAAYKARALSAGIDQPAVLRDMRTREGS